MSGGKAIFTKRTTKISTKVRTTVRLAQSANVNDRTGKRPFYMVHYIYRGCTTVFVTLCCCISAPRQLDQSFL